ncbi:uncharacterized protein [Drosophila virilis]|uniref:uncharacterized protein isoform X3 n=1 Tax=Drosophila virilis TaxID=7244 RepID=UPI0038B29A07
MCTRFYFFKTVAIISCGCCPPRFSKIQVGPAEIRLGVGSNGLEEQLWRRRWSRRRWAALTIWAVRWSPISLPEVRKSECCPPRFSKIQVGPAEIRLGRVRWLQRPGGAALEEAVEQEEAAQEEVGGSLEMNVTHQIFGNYVHQGGMYFQKSSRASKCRWPI